MERLVEFRARQAAALDWIDDDRAERPDAAGSCCSYRPSRTATPGYAAIRNEIAHRAAACRRPVVRVHGDEHVYEVERSYPKCHLTRLETFENSDPIAAGQGGPARPCHLRANPQTVCRLPQLTATPSAQPPIGAVQDVRGRVRPAPRQARALRRLRRRVPPVRASLPRFSKRSAKHLGLARAYCMRSSAHGMGAGAPPPTLADTLGVLRWHLAVTPTVFHLSWSSTTTSCSPTSQLDDARRAVNYDGRPVHNDLRRIECPIHQGNVELPGHDGCVREISTHFGDRRAGNVKQGRPDRCGGMGDEHITRLEAVKILRSGDETGGAAGATGTARHANQHTTPLAFLGAASDRGRAHQRFHEFQRGIFAPRGIREWGNGRRRCEPLLALSELASLYHTLGEVGGGAGPNFTSLQVEHVLCLIHGSESGQPLAGLEERRSQQRQDALEVEHGVVGVGGEALPRFDEPACPKATEPTQRAQVAFCLCPLLAGARQAFVGAGLAVEGHREVLGEEFR